MNQQISPALTENGLSRYFMLPIVRLTWRDRELEEGSIRDGAKMGQTVRQTMPFNASHAFMHASGIHGETPQARGGGSMSEILQHNWRVLV
jgi:hypothetical protein